MTKRTYDFWHKARAGYKPGSKELPIHDGQPELGFYRMRSREARAMGEGVGKLGPWLPVAIYEDAAGELRALVGGNKADPETIWLRCCYRAVSEEDYRCAITTGEWPDVDNSDKAEPIGEGGSYVMGSAEATAKGGAGGDGNANVATDDAAVIRAQLNKALIGAHAYKTIEDDQMAARAQSLRSRLNEFANDADKKRKAEADPHWTAYKAVNAKWETIIKDAKAAAAKIAAGLGAFETAKARASVAERKNEPLPTQIRPGEGRAASIAVVKVVTGIIDQDALYNFMRDHPDLIAKLADLAQRAVDKGHEVPGVTVEEQRKVK